jgi:hypothetical protein
MRKGGMDVKQIIAKLKPVLCSRQFLNMDDFGKTGSR